ncbi:kinase-like protein [Aspergillus homomorphus CBS 101889]|uniref:non-specific serine/threonine protein kinase n=1 Tax=Aspergillus homomorphus (strain CBS 101889) TaxID=1450537 RepID=A0A395HFB2_ASPHC|nr:kinase-like protein [Aspergillus homomorphus CBS 101889]RAL06582.1 kinase-like protein [Aspergillus homomorphus CBS 101889]
MPLWTAIITSLKSFSTGTTTSAPRTDYLQDARVFPTSGFESIQADHPVEEEELPDYQAHRFYPVRIGDIFESRYQVVAKLGYGSSSTTWLSRDLANNQYVALKVYVHTSLYHREVPVYEHMDHQLRTSPHQGRHNIRRLLHSFKLFGPSGTHTVLVFEAAQMSLRDMKLVFRQDGFDEEFVKGAVTELLQALDFLHTQANIVHTDVHPGNMLLGTYNSQLLKTLEDKEFSSPVPRKQVSPTRTVYLSRLMRPTEGPMLLSDFGEARIGQGPHGGDIMPLEYRAPETLLCIGWSYPVDIWSVGLTAWDLLEPRKLFTARDEDGDLYDAAHLAQLIAALGPPPPNFLRRNPDRKGDFWDRDGKWLNLAPIPNRRTFEALESRLEDKSGFLRFIRKALTWMPEDRATAKELLQDPWLAG